MPTGMRNISASVRQKLLNLSRERKEDFQWLCIRYASERLLYRLSLSAASDRFILKGAMLFTIWFNEPHRATRDIDFLIHGLPDIQVYRELFISICRQLHSEDGLDFDSDSLRIDEIREVDAYGGYRVRLNVYLDKIRIPIQVDMGFGDTVTPEPKMINYPTLLDMPQPRLLAYPMESVIAEKLHAIVILGMANSRMKDYYDLHVLFRQPALKTPHLIKAVKETFLCRKTKLPGLTPVGLTAYFAKDEAKVKQWQAFLKRNNIIDAPTSLTEVINDLNTFFDALWVEDTD